MSKKRKKDKLYTIKSVKQMFKKMTKREEHLYYRVYLYFYRLFWKAIRLPREVRQNIVASYQRAKRGYANRDTWGLADYLSGVISESVAYLRDHNMGYPNGLTPGKWIDILEEIRLTFETAKRICDGTLYFIENKKDRKRWQENLDELNEKYKTYDRCMSNEEIKRYKKGWKLFQEYFINLWD